MSPKPVIIVGESWNSIFSLLLLQLNDQPLVWIPGMGGSLLPPVDAMDIDFSKGQTLLNWLSLKYDIHLGKFHQHACLREFRNRAFHLPQWLAEQADELDEDQMEELVGIRETELFGPENAFAPVKTGHFEVRMIEFMGELNARVEKFIEEGRIKKIPNVRLKGIHKKQDGELEVTLSSGEKLLGSKLIYADRWAEISKVEGIKGEIHPLRVKKAKSVRIGEINRKWKPTGALQIVFDHDAELERSTFAQSTETFFTVLHKDSADDFARRAWGYFFDEGKKSIWTVFMTQKEVEDNKEITKKIRRVKQALNKIWSTGDHAQDERSFTDHVTQETVRFEESVVFEAPEQISYPFTCEGLENELILMTEGFGFTMAAEQSMIALSEYIDEAEISQPQESPEPEASP